MASVFLIRESPGKPWPSGNRARTIAVDLVPGVTVHTHRAPTGGVRRHGV